MMHKIFLTLKNEKQQRKLGAQLSKACQHKSCVMYLQGDLGAGKTTLARGFLQFLGYTDNIKSPTYSLIETYELDNRLTVLHIDLYRIEHPQEVFALGLRDYLNNPHDTQSVIYLIEWPEKALTELPSPDIACYIAPAHPTGRRCELTAHTEQGKKMMAILIEKYQQ